MRNIKKICKNLLITLLKYTGLKNPLKRLLTGYYLWRNNIKSIDLDKIVDFDNNTVTIENYHLGSSRGGLSVYESYVICALVRHFEPKAIFEFGTYEGDTTYLMACNSNKSTRVFTISLPPESYGSTKYRVGIGEKNYLSSADHTGIRFKGTKYEPRIEQLMCDSANFDHTRFTHDIDFVFIDGSHTYQYVKNDTLKAMEMVSERGVIVWHDYAESSFGVPKFLSELSTKVNLFHIKNTSLVVKPP